MRVSVYNATRVALSYQVLKSRVIVQSHASRVAKLSLTDKSYSSTK